MLSHVQEFVNYSSSKKQNLFGSFKFIFWILGFHCDVGSESISCLVMDVV